MTAPKLTPAQVRALMWLAVKPGKWRCPHETCHETNDFATLRDAGLVEEWRWIEERYWSFRATPAGLALAKEVG